MAADVSVTCCRGDEFLISSGDLGRFPAEWQRQIAATVSTANKLMRHGAVLRSVGQPEGTD